MIEPSQAHYWGSIAHEIIFQNGSLASVPTDDKRWMNGMYRVNPKGEVDGNGEIQVISIIGPIGKYSFCGSPGSQALQQAVRAASMDNSVCAIILNIDSPRWSGRRYR